MIFYDFPKCTIEPIMYNDKEGSLHIVLKITHYVIVPPWKGNPVDCMSDLDYYGYVSLEWEVDEATFYPNDEGCAKISIDKNIVLDLLSLSERDDIQSYLESFMADIDRGDESDVICHFIG